jgi:DNA repair protein RadC
MTDLTALIREVTGCRKAEALAIANACPPHSYNSLTVSQLVALGLTGKQADIFRAAMRLGERVQHAQTAQDAGASIDMPLEAVAELRKRFDIGALEQEHFWVIALNARNKILDVFTVGIGALSSVDIHPREVFKPLIRMAAFACVIAHNHPSNDASPSEADFRLTQRIHECGKLMAIPVLDSLVVTADDYFSLAEVGML